MKNLKIGRKRKKFKKFLHPERQKQAESIRKYFEDPENRKKNSNALKKYYKDCPNSRLKLSIAAKKKFDNPLERLKTSRGSRKRFEDPKERDKISIAQKIRYEDPETRKKNSDAIKLAWAIDPKYREQHKKSLIKYYSNPKNREKSSKIHKLLWQNDKFRKRMIPIVIKNRLISTVMNKKEQKLLTLLEAYNFKFNGNGNNIKTVASFCPDFINDEKKLIIELNGCHWHRCRKCYPDKFKHQNFCRRDLAKLHAYPREGYRILFIWEHELRDDLEKLNQKIENFINDSQYPTRLQD